LKAAALDTRIGSLDPETQRLKRAEIAERYRRKHKPFSFAELRVEEITRLARHRHGPELPEAKKYFRWSADKLASIKWLAVSAAERATLDLKTIGALDLPKKEREALRRERYRNRKRMLDTAWHQRQRRKQGKPTRAVSEATSNSRTKPWLAAGFKTRRTWERHGRPPVRHNVASASCTYTDHKRARHTCDTPRKRLRSADQQPTAPRHKRRRSRRRRQSSGRS
jgi:hypothetical protein